MTDDPDDYPTPTQLFGEDYLYALLLAMVLEECTTARPDELDS
jgi:hypothetical protein